MEAEMYHGKLIDFLHEKPKVLYELLDYKLGYIDQVWEYLAKTRSLYYHQV